MFFFLRRRDRPLPPHECWSRDHRPSYHKCSWSQWITPNIQWVETSPLNSSATASKLKSCPCCHLHQSGQLPRGASSANNFHAGSRAFSIFIPPSLVYFNPSAYLLKLSSRFKSSRCPCTWFDLIGFWLLLPQEEDLPQRPIIFLDFYCGSALSN
jgi:hypothetical protein